MTKTAVDKNWWELWFDTDASYKYRRLNSWTPHNVDGINFAEAYRNYNNAMRMSVTAGCTSHVGINNATADHVLVTAAVKTHETMSCQKTVQ